MPELPEIERTVRAISPCIAKHKLLSWDLKSSRLAQTADVSTFGQPMCERVLRWGKYLIISYDNEMSMVFHFGMTGYMRFDQEPNYTRLTLTFDNGILYFSDMRNWGKLFIVPTRALRKQPYLAKLGPDATSLAFNSDYLLKVCARDYREIKTILMDQTVVAGIGNIYANEALFMSGINPDTYGIKLDANACSQLVTTIKETLQFFIENGGGHSADYHKVYNRALKPCPVCGTPIVRYELGGRGTFRCPECQKGVTLRGLKYHS